MNRGEEIWRFIENSRAELQQPMLNNKLVTNTIDQWIKRLAPIPNQYLESCYEKAMSVHTTRSPLMPHEMLLQWQLLVESGVNKPTEKMREDKRCPNHCTWDGWVVTNASQAISFDFGTSEYQFAKPCEIHRPQGWKVPAGMELGARVHKLETSHVPSGPMTPKVALRSERDDYQPYVAPESVHYARNFQSVGSVAKAVLAQDALAFPPPEPIRFDATQEADEEIGIDASLIDEYYETLTPEGDEEAGRLLTDEEKGYEEPWD